MARVFGKAAVFAAAGAASADAADSPPNYEMMWAEFKNKFEKSYGHEHNKRFEIFKANVDIIQDVNSKNLSTHWASISFQT